MRPDLATADKYKILKLRGFNFPVGEGKENPRQAGSGRRLEEAAVKAEPKLDFHDVCDVRALAIAVINKCAVTIQNRMVDTERNLPSNIESEFGGAAPGTAQSAWHGEQTFEYLKAATTDYDTLIEEWDGCTYNKILQGLQNFGPNVPGLGYVSQVRQTRTSQRRCASPSTPTPRAASAPSPTLPSTPIHGFSHSPRPISLTKPPSPPGRSLPLRQ